MCSAGSSSTFRAYASHGLRIIATRRSLKCASSSDVNRVGGVAVAPPRGESPLAPAARWFVGVGVGAADEEAASTRGLDVDLDLDSPRATEAAEDDATPTPTPTPSDAAAETDARSVSRTVAASDAAPRRRMTRDASRGARGVSPRVTKC